MTQFYNEYSKVLVSVDCIIFGFDGSNLQVLIGKRKMDREEANGHSMVVSLAQQKISKMLPTESSWNLLE